MDSVTQSPRNGQKGVQQMLKFVAICSLKLGSLEKLEDVKLLSIVHPKKSIKGA